VRADDDDFVRLLGARDFRDCVINFDGLPAEAALNIHFRFDGACFQQALQQLTIFIGDVSGGNRALRVVSAGSSDAHVQESERLVGAVQNRDDAL